MALCIVQLAKVNSVIKGCHAYHNFSEPGDADRRCYVNYTAFLLFW